MMMIGMAVMVSLVLCAAMFAIWHFTRTRKKSARPAPAMSFALKTPRGPKAVHAMAAAGAATTEIAWKTGPQIGMSLDP